MPNKHSFLETLHPPPACLFSHHSSCELLHSGCIMNPKPHANDGKRAMLMPINEMVLMLQTHTKFLQSCSMCFASTLPVLSNIWCSKSLLICAVALAQARCCSSIE